MVAATLQQIYGEELAAPNYHLPHREPRERRLAHQFMFVYNKVLAEQAQSMTAANVEKHSRDLHAYPERLDALPAISTGEIRPKRSLSEPSEPTSIYDSAMMHKPKIIPATRDFGDCSGLSS